MRKHQGMIQLEEWIVIAITIFIVLSIAYVFSFKVGKKLFPQNVTFKTDIKPLEGATVWEIGGSGIIKVVQIETNENCIIDITVDGLSRTLLTVGPDPRLFDSSKQNQDVLSVREQLETKFVQNSTIHVQNRGAGTLHSSGSVSFEIKKGLKTSLKAVFSEL